MAELTPQGYVGKTQNEYYTEGIQLLLDIDINWDVDVSTPDGQITLNNSELYGNFDELLGLVNGTKDPNQATGQYLDTLCSITGLTRSPGTASFVILDLTGDNGTLVPQSSILGSADNDLQWTTDGPVTLLGSSTPVSVNATCTTLGANTASINTITQIVTPIGGWQTCTNPAVAVVGQSEQGDASLRLERNASVGRPGQNQVDSIAGELFATEGVTTVLIYNNRAQIPDANGIPGNAMAIYVIGGADADVARSIYVKLAAGPLMWADPGATAVTLTVISSEYPWNTEEITFNRPAQLPILVVVTIADDGSLPSDIEQLVKDNIIAYAAGGEPAAECGFNNAGFGIAEDVIYSRMYTPVNQIIGSYGNSYITNLTINGVASNISVAFDEISQWLDANITVNIV